MCRGCDPGGWGPISLYDGAGVAAAGVAYVEVVAEDEEVDGSVQLTLLPQDRTVSSESARTTVEKESMSASTGVPQTLAAPSAAWISPMTPRPSSVSSPTPGHPEAPRAMTRYSPSSRAVKAMSSSARPSQPSAERTLTWPRMWERPSSSSRRKL
ncbi:hypothetical protein WU86_06690 [Corynebacterium xerosis]|nr:hypothetical protein WU86_06690 [Corynebacterium xerosis]